MKHIKKKLKQTWTVRNYFFKKYRHCIIILHKKTIQDICCVFSNIGVVVILVYMEVSALRDVASVTCNIIFRESDVIIVLGKLCVSWFPGLYAYHVKVLRDNFMGKTVYIQAFPV